ncbi:MAG: glycosyltransferase [Ferruginibacter sp.]|nr:glycosyltransferase [Ferruginibacter sp.]
MDIVFFVHPDFLDSQSMPRFARMLEAGMAGRGHTISSWTAKPRFFRLPFPKSIKKWMGYIDQFIIFPLEVKRRLKNRTGNTIFVFTDHALGPWVPLVAKFPHVIHCHDFLAQRSGLGEIPENMSSWTGRQYQNFIRRGYSKGKNFISVSEKTRDELHRFMGFLPHCSEMVYNGLNQSFQPNNPQVAGELLSKKFNIDLSDGFILHVGGNQWYKNRLGLIEIYNSWRLISKLNLPLLLIGDQPSAELVSAHTESKFKPDIHFISGVEDENVRLAYSAAAVFIFPSLAEGFGWPIAEAMASGCPVITTNEAPMTEVSGNAGFQIDRRPGNAESVMNWAAESAKLVEMVLTLSPADRGSVIERGLLNVKRFDSKTALDQVEIIYKNVLQTYRN